MTLVKMLADMRRREVPKGSPIVLVLPKRWHQAARDEFGDSVVIVEPHFGAHAKAKG